MKIHRHTYVCDKVQKKVGGVAKSIVGGIATKQLEHKAVKAYKQHFRNEIQIPKGLDYLQRQHIERR